MNSPEIVATIKVFAAPAYFGIESLSYYIIII